MTNPKSLVTIGSIILLCLTMATLAGCAGGRSIAGNVTYCLTPDNCKTITVQEDKTVALYEEFSSEELSDASFDAAVAEAVRAGGGE